MTKTIALTTVLCAAACGSNLSFSARAGSPTPAVAASPRALTLSSGIVLSRVRIVLRDVKLEKATGNASDDSDDDEIAAGPLLLDLQGSTLDQGGVQKVLDASFQPGTYKEIKLKIHKLTSSDSFAGNAGLQAMSDAGASMIVEGTIDGATFAFNTSVESKQEFEGAIELKTGSNLTLTVDPAGWFTGSGGRLDPRVEGNRPQIEDNIKKSFKAFKDDDHNGHDD
jgi:hypothetical protein